MLLIRSNAESLHTLPHIINGPNWLMLGVNGGLQVCTLGKEELSKMPAEKNAIAIRRCGGPGAHDPI